ncbi:hypothetical protein AXK59_23360 [Tsukamurella tyrosinosolvens]|nr:hypothetical protein AXK59_23360 [Tsukamurella tyrosinosolvens]KZL94545.1 hypothetical protein AXX05_08875 [Tsukamurella tyrosinosolvens]
MIRERYDGVVAATATPGGDVNTAEYLEVTRSGTNSQTQVEQQIQANLQLALESRSGAVVIGDHMITCRSVPAWTRRDRLIRRRELPRMHQSAHRIQLVLHLVHTLIPTSPATILEILVHIRPPQRDRQIQRPAVIDVVDEVSGHFPSCGLDGGAGTDRQPRLQRGRIPRCRIHLPLAAPAYSQRCEPVEERLLSLRDPGFWRAQPHRRYLRLGWVRT